MKLIYREGLSSWHFTAGFRHFEEDSPRYSLMPDNSRFTARQIFRAIGASRGRLRRSAARPHGTMPVLRLARSDGPDRSVAHLRFINTAIARGRCELLSV